jgi:RNA polymerase sigma-70 factor (ECF subfamily)
LVRVARRILRNPELADDAVQDTYLRVAEMRSDTEIARPAAYWTRAVCNMALDYLRRQERENTYRTHGVDVETLELPVRRSPERLLFESQAMRLIDQALDEVPPKTRETFELYRIKGLTQRQIAEHMQCALGLVNARIADACKAISVHRSLLDYH